MRNVEQFKLNELGNDYVVGDLHGTFQLLEIVLKKVRFQPGKDRLFCTGDLIDRGCGSCDVVTYLSRDGFYSIRGNHEENFINASLSEIRINSISNPYLLLDWEWTFKLSDEKLIDIKNHLAKLPYLIEVATPNGIVAIVHADVPSGMNWQNFRHLVSMNDLDAIECAIWSRARIKSRNKSGVDGVSSVVAGHSFVSKPLRLGNFLAIDTGAFMNPITGEMPGSLTLINLKTLKIACVANY